MSGSKYIQIIKGFFLLKIFFHKMRKKPKAILLPSHPTRDSYFLVADMNGVDHWSWVLSNIAPHGVIPKFVKAYLSNQI